MGSEGKCVKGTGIAKIAEGIKKAGIEGRESKRKGQKRKRNGSRGLEIKKIG